MICLNFQIPTIVVQLEAMRCHSSVGEAMVVYPNILEPGFVFCTVEREQLELVNGLCFHLRLQDYHTYMYVQIHFCTHFIYKIKILSLPCHGLNDCFSFESTTCYRKSIMLWSKPGTGNFEAHYCAAFQLLALNKGLKGILNSAKSIKI